MTQDQFDSACRAFVRRRPSRAFLIEFTSGKQVLVGHPEAVRNEAQLYLMRCLDGGYVVFAPDGVSRLLDVPTATTT
jgi:hypothetical protein